MVFCYVDVWCLNLIFCVGLCYIFVTFVEIVIIQVHKVVVELWNRPLFIEAWILFIYFFRINGL